MLDMQEVRTFSKNCHKKRKKENQKWWPKGRILKLIFCYPRCTKNEFIFEFIGRENH